MSSGLDGVDTWLIESLAVPASLHDVEGRFVQVNEAAERASGRSRAYWLGRLLTDSLPPEARERVSAQFRRVVECCEPADFETVFIDPRGRRRGVRVQHLPVAFGGVVVGVLILAFDVWLAAERVGVESEPRLTPRERQVLELLDAGLSTPEMAKELTLSRETVRNHVRRVLRELGVHTRLEAIAAARRHGLLAPPALRPLGVE